MAKNIKKAEDILTDDRLVAELADKFDKSGDINNDKQFKLAVIIYRALFRNRAFIGKSQKQSLGLRIDQSINAYKRRIQFYRIAAAAVFIGLLAVPSAIFLNQESDLEKFAKNAPSVKSVTNTRLVLAEQAIEIDKRKSNIEYLQNGSAITIDSVAAANQKLALGEVALNTLIVPYGKRTTIILSDQTKVWLNSGSRLIFPASFTEKKREVYLDGEAMFEVSHDKTHPFIVNTRDIDVEVLGTIFNLSAYGDDSLINTVLVEGAVEIEYAGNKILGRLSSSITPGTLASYNANTERLEEKKINTQLYTSWRDGYLVFEQQPLGDIVKKIARYYDVEIVLDDPALAYETFSGNLDLQNSAFEVLNVVAEIVNARIEQRDDKLIISKI